MECLAGESILMCKDSEKSKVTALFATSMGPVSSCLIPYSNGKLGTTMLRAALEIIANGAAKSVKEVTGYLDCTLFSAAMVSSFTFPLQKNHNFEAEIRENSK
jgi:DNA polymerase theta